MGDTSDKSSDELDEQGEYCRKRIKISKPSDTSGENKIDLLDESDCSSSSDSSDGYFSVESDTSGESYQDPNPSKQEHIAESKGNIKCDVVPCLLRFETRNNMRQHLVDDHELTVACPHSGCDRLFKSEHCVRRHTLTHYNKTNTSEPVVSKCKICGGHLRSLLAHIGTCLKRRGVLDKVIKMVVSGDIK